jgi:hypothetical protein
MARKPKKEIKVVPVKRGRRHYGAIYIWPDGLKVYMAHRRIREVFRAGEPSIAAAIDKGVAAWALDEETLIQMRAQGIRYAGVMVRETGERFLTDLSWFFDKKKAKVLNYETRGGALQRYLPLQYFRRRGGRASFKA